MILDFKTIRYNKSYNKIYIELRLNFLHFGWFENSAALLPPSCHRKCFSFCLILRLYLSTYIISHFLLISSILKPTQRQLLQESSKQRIFCQVSLWHLKNFRRYFCYAKSYHQHFKKNYGINWVANLISKPPGHRM